MNVQVFATAFIYAVVVLLHFEWTGAFQRSLVSSHLRPSQRLESSYKGGSMDHVSQFMHLLEQLKMKKRLGWYESEIRDFENIASDHFDFQKFLLMTMVHGMAESIIITDSSITLEEKCRLEDLAMEEFRTILCTSSFGDDVIAVLKEYVANETPESRFVKQLDLLPTPNAFEKSEFFDQSLTEQLEQYKNSLVNQDRSAGRLLFELPFSEDLEQDNFLQ